MPSYLKYQFILIIVFFCTTLALRAQDEIHQLIGNITASSIAPQSDINNAIDGLQNTSWVSNNPLPTNYYRNAYQNLLLQPSRIELSNIYPEATNSYSPTITLPAEAFINFSSPEDIYLLGLKINGLQEKVTISFYDSLGIVSSEEFLPSQNYNNIRFVVDLVNIEKIKLSSITAFTLVNIAILEDLPKEFITLDLGDNFAVSELRTKHWAGNNNAIATQLLAGNHPDSLNFLAALQPNEIAFISTSFVEPIVARYFRIEHTVIPQDYKKVTVFEMEAYGDSIAAPDPVIPEPAPTSWDPDAGLYPALSKAATVNASSSASNSQNRPEAIMDENNATAWLSSNPLPDAYVSNARQNILLNESGIANNGANMVNATDGNLGNSTPSLTLVNGEATFTLNLTPISVHRLGLRLVNNHPELVNILVTNLQGDTLRTTYTNTTVGHVRFPIEMEEVSYVSLTSSAPFAIQEIAAYSAPLSEFVTLDLNEVKPVSRIAAKQWNGNNTAISSKLWVGPTLDSLSLLAELNPNSLDIHNIELPEGNRTRFIRLEQQLVDINYKKATVQELTVYDEFGSYGPPPAPKPQSSSFGKLFGVNTVWAWGTKKVPNLQGPDEGAQKFIRAANQARNYHNIHWDTADPDITPTYGGENPVVLRPWTQWTREYKDWMDKGFEVDATFTFDRFLESVWDQPFASGYGLGHAFASTFGPSHENLIRTVEVGNEPWDYSDSTYRKILEGTAQGLKTADPMIKVLPAALQASHPTTNEGQKNYMGSKLNEAAAPYLDGVNLHLYSYYRNTEGERIAVHPEHPASEMRALFSGLRFRDANMPGKEVHVTEWGWDASSKNETAINSEAVSPISQAVYALRGLFWLSRMGVDKAHWYFFSNVDTLAGIDPINYQRSGLTESGHFGFREKRAFTAAEAMQNRMGNLYFEDVIKEDEQAYIYQLRNEEGELTHLVAWRPVSGDDSLAVNYQLPVDFPAQDAWYLSGISPNGENVTLSYANGKLTLPLSSKPLLIQLGDSLQNGATIPMEGNLKVIENDAKFELRLTTNIPLKSPEEITLINEQTPLMDPSIKWTQASALLWEADLSTLDPGTYHTRAELGANKVQTNRVSMDIPDRFMLSPNPTQGKSTLRLIQEFTEVTKLTIIRLDGLPIRSFILPAYSSTEDLDLSGLKNGTYLIRLENSNFKGQQKFIKQ
ncbi:T9SS type A sorting domain-containing protein [uncultured Cyclobacterium sp.]|uniref:T9SS type A sorting domain-containing protein n=1 Tax=uncultured Cyclobacterium sp. TaxID=453820 RepID=UPI0030ED8A00|tara:strand:- start:46486 stop:50058 length:3573 start_codon:yes stop_codon:yes gene_type:complete